MKTLRRTLYSFAFILATLSLGKGFNQHLSEKIDSNIISFVKADSDVELVVNEVSYLGETKQISPIKKVEQASSKTASYKRRSIKKSPLAKRLNIKNVQNEQKYLKPAVAKEIGINDKEFIVLKRIDVQLPQKINLLALYKPLKNPTTLKDIKPKKLLAKKSGPIEPLLKANESLQKTTDTIKLKPLVLDTQTSGYSSRLKEKAGEQSVASMQSPSVHLSAKELEPSVASVTQSDSLSLMLSGNIKKAIKRARTKVTTHATAGNRNKGKVVPVRVNTQSVLPKKNQIPAQKASNNDYSGFLEQQMGGAKEFNSKVIIKAMEILPGEAIGNNIKSFELFENWGHGEYQSSNEEGQVSIERNISDGIHYLNAMVAQTDFLETQTDIAIEDGLFETVVPLFNKKQYEEFLKLNNLDADGLGHILVALDTLTQKIELLDSQYLKLFYFDENMQKVDSLSMAKFALFAGVEVGNAVLSYRVKHFSWINKIVTVGEERLLFEVNNYDKNYKFDLNIFEEKPMGLTQNAFSGKASDIQLFNSTIKAEGISLGRYEIESGYSNLHGRNYLEFHHLETAVFLGIGNSRDLVVPTLAYKEMIFQELEIEDLENKCLVQLNFKKVASSISLRGYNGSSEFNITPHYLEKNGEWVEELSMNTRKVFIEANDQGSIYLKIDYQDGKSEFLSSVCSENTYLIEQL